VSGAPGEWPPVLQEMFAASQRNFPLRFRGYDRRAVDAALRGATARLKASVDEAEAYVELAGVLDEQVEEARIALAEYDRLHAGEEVRRAEDPFTRDVVARACHETDAIVEDARRDARLVVEREEQAVATRMRSLEDEELEVRQRLAASTATAGDVIRTARSNCTRLLARLIGRQQVLDEWADEFSALLDVLPSFHGTVDIPQSRKSEEAVSPRVRAPETDLAPAETA
jgi:hypothetical protein